MSDIKTMNRAQLRTRLTQLRDMLADSDADLDAIEQEISEIETALAALEEVLEEAEEAPAEPEERETEEEPAEQPEGSEEEQQAEEEPPEQRMSAARQRAQLRAMVAAGQIGAVTRTFNSMEGRKMIWTPDTKEYRNAWLQNLQGKPIDAQQRAALSGGNNVIPQETVNKIYGAMELYPLLSAIDVMHIPGTVVLPVEGTVADPTIVAMATAATDSPDTVTSVSLGAYKLIKTIEITADVMAMAVSAFEDWLVARLANKMYRAVTSLVATGTGSNQPAGLTTIAATGKTYTKAGITYKDILKIISDLPSEWLPNAKFVMSRQVFFTQVLGLEDTNKQPIVVADRQAPAIYNVLGFPVILEDTLNDTGSIVFGDLKEGYVFNFGKEIEVARDESVGFRAGTTVFRGMCLGDGKPTGVGLVRYVPAT